MYNFADHSRMRQSTGSMITILGEGEAVADGTSKSRITFWDMQLALPSEIPSLNAWWPDGRAKSVQSYVARAKGTSIWHMWFQEIQQCEEMWRTADCGLELDGEHKHACTVWS
ncbi:hypothetical protein B0H21DRAFT_708325 [Amylocystis lapponica]|nr:hypothetical protein B0H21DRAFT_708325 [Amylocystis lapponica]